jgi:ribonuclease HI
MPAPSTPEARNLHREAQALIEQAAVQQAESSASRIRQQGSTRDDGGAQGPEPSVHAGGAAERPANPGRAPAKERLLDTRGQAQDGDARNVINARRMSNAEAWAAAGYHPRRGGRYDRGEDRSTTPEPLGTRVFSREIRTTTFPQRFRQPTTIVKYNGETDPRVWLNDYRLACQLGGATSDEVIIRNLPLHLADSARMWLDHLPASQIHNWDDLVRTFVGNFQGTYVRPGNSWDLRSCTQKPGESLRDFIRRFSRRCTELPSVAQSEIVHAFLKGTTCRDLVRELGRSPPVDSNELFDIATSFASGKEAVGAIFDGKKGKRADDTPAEGSKSMELRQKNKRGKKAKKPRREAREQGHDDDDGEDLAVDPARRGPRPAPRGAGVFDDMLKKPCPYHKTPVNHTLEQCDMLKRFYIGEILSDTKTRYLQVQKLLYAVVLARCKLRHYFEAHPVTVVSSFPLGEIILNPDAAGRIAKWSVELMGETPAYAPRKAIKSQILADFVVEWTDTQLPPPQIQAECWTLYFDGSVMKTGAGAGLLFVSPLGKHMRYAVRLHFPASNNMAEYKALLCGLKIAIEIGIKRLDVRGDSQLVIDQVMKNANCHDDKMEAYCKAMRALEDKFYGIELNHVPRRYNEEADELAKITSGRITVPPNVFAQDVA